MICCADRKSLLRLQCNDPFYTRVLSLFESYGTEVDFVGFWTQEIDDDTVAVISRFENKFSLYLTEKSDLEEVAAFLHFQGAGAAMYDPRFPLEIPFEYEINGKVLAYQKEHYISNLELYTPEIKELYALLKSCESEIFRVPDYMSFLSDVTHRRNLNKCAILGTSVDGNLASSVMTVSFLTFSQNRIPAKISRIWISPMPSSISLETR